MPTVHSHFEALPEADRRYLASWLEDFVQAWEPHRLRLWCDRLEELPECLRHPALIELVKRDLQKQWELGKRPCLEGYLHFYPQLGTGESLATTLVQTEYELRLQYGATADLEHFARRFPRQVERLQQRGWNPPSTPREENQLAQTRHQPPSTASLSRAPAFIPSLPEHFGRYHIRQTLGRGGMGTVYLAFDTHLEREVAIKVCHPTSSDDHETLVRFQREGRAAAGLHHPNLCTVYECSTIDAIHFMSMAYIEGPTLAEWIIQEKPHKGPEEEVARLVCKLAHAMQHAHDANIIHRDLKPANIKLDRRGEPIILDFGLARRIDAQDVAVTRRGSLLGTLLYMSPEQVSGLTHEITARSDIYSLGVILYELLVGEPPFLGPSTVVAAKILTEQPLPPSRRRPDLDPRLETICLQAMAKEANARFTNMADFAHALSGYSHATIQRRPVSPLTVHIGARDAQPPSQQPDEGTSASSASSNETPDTETRQALELYIRSCGCVDLFIDEQEEYEIFRRGGSAGLTPTQVEAALHRVCRAEGWTRQTRLTPKLVALLRAAARVGKGIRQKDFEHIINFAVRHKMPRREASEHCVTLILDHNLPTSQGWRGMLGWGWWGQKRRQYGL